jgi:microcystin degradation protein MlrC
MTTALAAGGPWDGVLCGLHGAAVSERHLDADGELLRRIRSVVGPAVPVGAALDLHATVSPAMAGYADVITAFQTNPHVDAFEQGLACARLVGRTARGEIRPRLALAAPPLVIDILRQGTGEEPMAGVLARARELAARPGVLLVNVCEGFPYADVPELGMTFLAVADGDPELASEVAGELAGYAWRRRADFTGTATRLDEALTVAAAAGSGPVVLLDTGDNVPGGSPGDSTHILHAARRLGVSGIVQLLTDPAAVQACAAAGPGGVVHLEVGAPALPVRGTVTSIGDGRFEDPTPTHGGIRFFDMGPTAGLRTDDGFDLILTSCPEGTLSLEQLRLVGLEPARQRIIVAKGVHSPRAAFAPIASALVEVATPGPTAADLSTFTYRHRRRPMFPFEPDAEWSP